ncbi:hypothetical protein [Streptomyces sp. NPDC050856]|uniref:hypothetical protein n=1 Tax=Streptomyces sp. NPDC050856 TaxID=3154939 RepID=UPI003407788C
MALIARGFDPLGAGALEDGVAAHPLRPAVVAGGAGQRGDGLQVVATNRCAVIDADGPFGGAFLEAAVRALPAQAPLGR